MKKLFPLLMIFMLMCMFSFSQNTETTDKPPAKKSQSTLYNDCYAGYGALSVYYFTGNFSHSFDLSYYSSQSEPQSVGSFFIGYGRSLNRVVSTGFMFGYQKFQTTGNEHVGSTGTIVPVTINDNLIMGMARVTFSYLNKPVVRMYSGVGIGITIDLGKVNGNVESHSDRKLLPGGQITLMGLRFGRAFGGFIEFGFGTYGIVNAGLSYRFAD